MTDHGRRIHLALVFFHEFLRAGKGHLVDVFFYIFGSHADAAVDDADLFLLLVHLHANRQVAHFAFELAQIGQVLQFVGGVHRVGDQLPQEDFVVAVEEFFDDGENILRGDIDFSSCHNVQNLKFCWT